MPPAYVFQPITWRHVAYPSRARLINCSLLHEISISTNREHSERCPGLEAIVEDQDPHKSNSYAAGPRSARKLPRTVGPDADRDANISSGNVINEQPTNHPGPHPSRTLKDKWRRLISGSPDEDDHRGVAEQIHMTCPITLPTRLALLNAQYSIYTVFYSTTKDILKQPPVRDSVEDFEEFVFYARIGARSI
ncbi:hypothetical protein GW17_00022555 [Ensete ventricosum]|nr:hypothetical protein GW17_00022555 [Ensete ventricosum]